MGAGSLNARVSQNEGRENREVSYVCKAREELARPELDLNGVALGQVDYGEDEEDDGGDEPEGPLQRAVGSRHGK